MLQQCATPKAFRDALKKLPKTLEETYTAAIERLKQSEHLDDGVQQLLMWLAYAFKPLSIAQVTEILAVDLVAQTFDPDARSLELENRSYDILDSTLITVNPREKVVQLAHNSVKEFLTQIQGQSHLSKLVEINEHLAHSTICQTCLIYLLQFDSLQVYAFKDEYPLARYAAEFWPVHMKSLQNGLSEKEKAKDLALALLKDSSKPHYVNSIKIHAPDHTYDIQNYNPYLNPTNISSPLYYLACHGLQSIAEYLLLENMADVNDAKGGRLGTALHAAAYRENIEFVQILLEHKADVKAQGGCYGNALQAAAFVGSKVIVQMLLDHKADVDVQGGEYGSALHAASIHGHEDIVQLLLEHQALQFH